MPLVYVHTLTVILLEHLFRESGPRGWVSSIDVQHYRSKRERALLREIALRGKIHAFRSKHGYWRGRNLQPQEKSPPGPLVDAGDAWRCRESGKVWEGKKVALV